MTNGNGAATTNISIGDGAIVSVLNIKITTSSDSYVISLNDVDASNYVNSVSTN